MVYVYIRSLSVPLSLSLACAAVDDRGNKPATASLPLSNERQSERARALQIEFQGD